MSDTLRKPFVSIGLPVYNAEQYLSGALHSLLHQSYDNFELIISDNASTDKTEEICLLNALEDDRIRYYRTEVNKGAAWNFNRVFFLARGEYFKWAAADDECSPDYLQSLVSYFETQSSSVVLCYPKTTLIDHEGQPMGVYEDRLDLRESQPHRRLQHFFRQVLLCNPVFGIISTMALEQTRLIDSFVGSDQVLLAELAMLGEFHEIPEHLFFRRRHPQSSGAANRSFLEVAVWFDPRNARRTDVYPANRWFVEYLRSIRNMPVSIAAKTRCLEIFLSEWYFRKNWRNVAGEWKIACKHFFNIQNGPTLKKSGHIISPQLRS